jgi:hypothetical protein
LLFFWNEIILAASVEPEQPIAELNKITVTGRAEDLTGIADSASQGRLAISSSRSGLYYELVSC